MGNSVFAYISACQPVPLGWQVQSFSHNTLYLFIYIWIFQSWGTGWMVDKSTGEEVHNIHLPFASIFSSGCVNLAFGQVICYGYSVLVHLSTRQPVKLSPRVDRNLPGLTGRYVNKWVQGIMGKAYLSTCRPVNLSTRVERSSGKYSSARH